MTRELRCTAGHVVGTVLGPCYAGIVALRTNGQEVIVTGVICIRCACGAVYKPDVPALPLSDLELKMQTASVR